VRQARPDRHRPVREPHADVEHLRRQVAVGEPAATERAAPGKVEADVDLADVRLEADRVLDGAREPRGRAPADRDPQVLVEHPAELDAGLEQQRFATGEPRRVDRTLGHGAYPGSADGRRTVNGPTI